MNNVRDKVQDLVYASVSNTVWASINNNLWHSIHRSIRLASINDSVKDSIRRKYE
jgi:hypothetical protein